MAFKDRAFTPYDILIFGGKIEKPRKNKEKELFLTEKVKDDREKK